MHTSLTNSGNMNIEHTVKCNRSCIHRCTCELWQKNEMHSKTLVEICINHIHISSNGAND